MKFITSQHDRWVKAGGPTIALAKKSFQEVLDSIDMGIDENELIDQVKDIVKVSAFRFLEKFYDTYVNNKDSRIIYNKEVDDAFKGRRQDLSNLIHKLASNLQGYVILSNGQQVFLDLSQVRYVPNKKGFGYLFCINATGDVDDTEVVDFVVTQYKPKMFSCLFKGVVAIYKLLQQYAASDTVIRTCYQLALQLESVSNIGGFFGALEDEKKQFLDDAFDRLTRDRSEEREYFRSHDLYQILSDTNNLPDGRDILVRNFECEHLKGIYIQDVWDRVMMMIKARQDLPGKQLRPIINSLKRVDKVREDYSSKDLYISLRSGPGDVPVWCKDFSKNDFGKKSKFQKKVSETLIKSAFETDVLHCENFDKLVNFPYRYNTNYDGIYNGDVHRIVVIDNPNKYKPRIIHMFLNCVNDRLQYLERLGQLRHRLDKTLCTEDHKIGRDFVKNVTSPAFRQRDDMADASVILADWSDATDNVFQKEQLDVVEAFYGEEARELWEEVLSIPFTMVYPDGSKRIAVQINGQPQGMPTSFIEFGDLGEVCHCITEILMPVAEGRLSLEESVKAVGDDSVKVSLNDRYGLYFALYSAVCGFCGIKINASKSVILTPDMNTWSAEFCKVTSLEGQYFSKIPHSLLFRSAESIASRIGCYSWMQTYGYDTTSALWNLINSHFGEEAEMILSAFKYGWSKGFSQFQTNDFSEIEWNSDLTLYYMVFTICHVRSMVVDAYFSERVQLAYRRDNFDVWDSCYKLFHKRDIFDRILDELNPKHKLLDIMDDNVTANMVLHDLCCNFIGVCDYSDLPVFGILDIDETVLGHLGKLADLFNSMKRINFYNWKEVVDEYRLDIIECCGKLLTTKALYRYRERKLSRGMGSIGEIFQKSCELLKEIKDKAKATTMTIVS